MSIKLMTNNHLLHDYIPIISAAIYIPIVHFYKTNKNSIAHKKKITNVYWKIMKILNEILYYYIIETRRNLFKMNKFNTFVI